MRRLLLGGVLVVALLSVACGPGQALFVHKSRIGQKSEPELGRKVPFERITKADQASHPTPGFSILHGKQEWDLFFADHPSHPFTTGINFARDMVIAGYSAEPKAKRLETHLVVESERALHVYVNQVFPGEGCLANDGPAAFDLVTVPRSDKAVHVHLDSVQEAPCDLSSPDALLACRANAEAPWASEVVAKVGDVVECEAAIKAGSRLVIDRGWTLEETPTGSQSKLAYQAGGARVRFPVDALGRYRVRVSALDDAGKRGEAEARVDTGTHEGTSIELYWTDVDRSIDPGAYPKLELRAVDASGSGGRRECSAAVKDKERPAWCDVKQQIATTLVHIEANPPGRYALSVRFAEGSPEKGTPCVRTSIGTRTVSEKCDPTPRKAGAVWDLGVLDGLTGNFEGYGTFEAQGVAKVELDKPLPPEVLKMADLERRYVAKYAADGRALEGFRLPGTAGSAASATDVWAILEEGPYAEWTRKFGPGEAPPALARAAITAAEAGLKVKAIVVDSPKITSGAGLGVGSSLADLKAKMEAKPKTKKVPALFGKDECAVDDGTTRYLFTTCTDAKKSNGRVGMVIVGGGNVKP